MTLTRFVVAACAMLLFGAGAANAQTRRKPWRPMAAS